MTIIMFLVDTSASMNQKAYVNGVPKTYLNIAKESVKTFLKYRQRTKECFNDRYMLLSFDESPNTIKCAWKEPYETFLSELNKLQPTGVTSLAMALKSAFDLLNLNRMQSGIDTFGKGRCPFHSEPTVIIVVTDGGKYFYRNEVKEDLIIPLRNPTPGSHLTKEPFRWDQRVFSLVLRMSGQSVDEPMDIIVPRDETKIEKMCKVTGGRSYKITSHRMLSRCIENMEKKIKPGVVIQLEQYVNSHSKSNVARPQTIKTMIYESKQNKSQSTSSNGRWPIPESYWPTSTLAKLPPRDAHPRIQISASCCDEPEIKPNFPIDVYELEHSPFNLQHLRKQAADKVWPVTASIGTRGHGTTFGYLKPNSNFTAMNLFVLPYDHKTLFPLVNDLLGKFKLRPNEDWLSKFDSYINSIPQYYCAFLRNAFHTLKVPYDLEQRMFPLSTNHYLSSEVLADIKQMQHVAKQYQDNLCLEVSKQVKLPKLECHQREDMKLNSGASLQQDLVSHPMLKEVFSKLHQQVIQYDDYVTVVPAILGNLTNYEDKHNRDPLDIPRNKLLEEMANMREIFYRSPASENRTIQCPPTLYKENQKVHSKSFKEITLPIKWIPKQDKSFKTDDCTSAVDEADLRATKRADGLLSTDYMHDWQSKKLSELTVTASSESTSEDDDNGSHVSEVDTDSIEEQDKVNSCLTNRALRFDKRETFERANEFEEHDNHNDHTCDMPYNVADLEARQRQRMFVKKEWIEESNIETRSLLFKEIRRPGRDKSNVLLYLTKLRGDQSVRYKYVNMCVKEALRFRRHDMVDCIREWWNNSVEGVAVTETQPQLVQQSCSAEATEDIEFGTVSDKCDRCWSCK